VLDRGHRLAKFLTLVAIRFLMIFNILENDFDKVFPLESLQMIYPTPVRIVQNPVYKTVENVSK